jgi:hypothetical protein
MKNPGHEISSREALRSETELHNRCNKTDSDSDSVAVSYGKSPYATEGWTGKKIRIMNTACRLAALILAVSVESLVVSNTGSFVKSPSGSSNSGTNPLSASRGILHEGRVVLRLRGGAARDILPLNSTEVELEKNAQPDPNQAQHDQRLNHQSHSEAPPILPHDAGVVGDPDQGYVQLPDDLRMPPGMQHMYQWEAPDGNQVTKQISKPWNPSEIMLHLLVHISLGLLTVSCASQRVYTCRNRALALTLYAW